MGEAGLKRVDENYSVKQVMQKYYDLYETVVSKARKNETTC